MTKPAALAVTIRIRIAVGENIAIGQGKADLLEAIGRTGSISAAARDLDMSYRKAWMLVDEMNQCFPSPAARGWTCWTRSRSACPACP